MSKFLNHSTASKYLTRKQIKVSDLSGSQYSVNKNVRRFKSPMLRSDLCDQIDAFITVKGKLTVEGTNDANKRNKNLTFKNNAPFRSWIQIKNY